MARKPLNVDRIRGGVTEVVNKAVDATVYLPLGIYDRARDQLTDLDATRLRKTFHGLLATSSTVVRIACSHSSAACGVSVARPRPE